MAPETTLLDGKWWVYPDGRRLALIAGGQDPPADPPADPPPPPDPDPEPDPDDLGEAGKRALERERAARKEEERRRKAADTRAKEIEAELARLKQQGESDQEKAVREATEAARKEEREKGERRVVAAEVKARAGTKLTDPEDAIRFLDLGEFTVDDDGQVDAKSIDTALDKLLKDKPYLAAGHKPGKPQGSADGGHRGDTDKPEPRPGADRLRRYFASQS